MLTEWWSLRNISVYEVTVWVLQREKRKTTESQDPDTFGDLLFIEHLIKENAILVHMRLYSTSLPVTEREIN